MAKTLVATGASGLGFDAARQLLADPQPYRLVLGARNPPAAEVAFARLPFDRAANAVSVLPLDLADLARVAAFAHQVLDTLGDAPIDYLLLNAALVADAADAADAGPRASRWCEARPPQHYLVHLLRDKLVSSRARVVVVSSGLIPNTGLGRSTDLGLSMDMPDAKTVPEGARSILAALTRADFPDDPDRIFLTSWGEWWPKDVYAKTLDRALQDKWCPTKEELEKAEGISS